MTKQWCAVKTALRDGSVWEKPNRNEFWLLVLALGALLSRLLLLPAIGHHGEAREGLVVQGILRHQQWILPFRNGEVPSKPPLFHWLAALFALPFGLSDFTMRLPSLLGAAIVVFAVYLLGKSISDGKTGCLAVGALLGIYEFWDTATQARVDMIFTACVTVALVSFYFWYREKSVAARVTCYCALAFAVLAKGPAGLVLPALVIGGFLLASRQIGLIREFCSWPLIGVVLLFDFGWYALAYHSGGNEFLRVQILRENVDRFLGSGGFSTRFNNLDLLSWLAGRSFPWNLALLWSAVQRIKGEKEDAAGRLLHSWWITIVVFFALATGKRSVYLLPIYPAMALLAARVLRGLFPDRAGPRHLAPVENVAARRSGPFQRRNFAPLISTAMVLIAVILMVQKTALWNNFKLVQPRVAFSESVGAIVPHDRPLYAVPELSEADLIVISYRLDREIAAKLVRRSQPGDYFLAPLDASLDCRGATIETLFQGADMVLFSVLAPVSDAKLPDNLTLGAVDCSPKDQGEY